MNNNHKHDNPSTATPALSDPVPADWTRPTAAFPTDRTVVDLFREQARSRPDAPAVQEGLRVMSYRELDQCSNRLAHELLRRGLQPEETVAVFMSASCDFLVAILGVLKAGCTYFPVATDIPEKRLEYLFTDSQTRVVLSNPAGIARLSSLSVPVLAVAELIAPSDAAKEGDPAIHVLPERRAYITYTSGSTGPPKGVQIEHRALTNFVFCCRQRFGITYRDRAAMAAYVSFDASVGDIWPALSAGGTLVIPPEGILQNPGKLVEWLAAERLTLAFVPTGLLEVILPRPWPKDMALRYLMTGGDRLRVRPPAGLSFALINGYGPTENTVFSTCCEVLPEDVDQQTPSIGRPFANTTAYVLDEHLRPVPVGKPGELFVGGAQVARGYIRQPELTRQKFIPDPFSAVPGARMYRTGDWARWLPSGELDFIGRKDAQIQIRGRRVELGEIEAAIATHASVRQVCCVPWLDDGMPAAVIAHVVPRQSGADPADELHAHLQPLLPDYMVPRKFVAHETLPLTPQGKVNRAALIALQPAAPEANPQIATGGSELEQTLARIWHTLLPAAANSPTDATFEMLGGDSLLAIKLLLSVEEIIGRPMELSAFLAQPTFAGLCRAVTARLAEADFEPVLKLYEHAGSAPLFILYGHSGDIDASMSLAHALGRDRTVYGIRSPALADISRLPASIEAAAAEALQFIRQLQPNGAPALIGYSWAGLLAFEIARQVFEQDGAVGFTAVIGTDAPLVTTTLPARLRHFGRHFPSWLWHLLGDSQRRWRRIGRWRENIAATANNLSRDRVDAPEWADRPVSRHLIALMEHYRPSSTPRISLDVIRERGSYSPRPHPLRAWRMHHLPDGGWNRWTSLPNRIHWVDGNHGTVVKPPLVAGLAEVIRAAYDRC